MDSQVWGTMMVIKEILAAMNSTGRSTDEEQIRQIMRDVLNETRTNSVPERDLVNSMMQLLQQNMTKQTAELQAAAAERDQYKVKLEELNQRMSQLMKDQGSHASGAEGPVLTANQKKLVEMLEEIRSIREAQRSEQGRSRKPFNRGEGKGGASGDFSHREQQYQGSGAFSKFNRQNKDGTQFYQGKAENFERAEHDSKSGGFHGKPFQQDNPQTGPMTFQKTFPQYSEREGGQNFDPPSRSRDVGRDHGAQYRYRQGDSGPEFGQRGGVQNMRMPHQSPYRDFSQHGDQYQKRDQVQQPRGQFQQPRGQFQHPRGQFQKPRGQFQHPRGQFHQSRGQFHQYHWQLQHHGQGQGSNPSSRPQEPNYNQLTPEEINAIKAVLKQQQQEQDKKSASALVVNSNKKASKKKKKQEKKPIGPTDLKPDDTDEETDDEEGEVKSSVEDVESPSADLGATAVDTTTDKSVTDSDNMNKKKKKKKKKKENSKDQAASPNKREDLSPLELFTASGFDLSQIAGLSMSEKVNDMMLIAKQDGNIVPCQPNTVGELVEFKRKYPNAQAIIVKTSEQK